MLPVSPLSLHQEKTPLGWRSQLPTRSRARVPAEVEASTMTSRASTECLVYVTLPGETESVAAGKFELTKDRHGTALGHFLYDKS
jgi:hypothetical protein